MAIPLITTHALANSLFGVTLECDGEVIGCGRVIGDGGLCFYVQDIIVLPDYQGRGYGRLIMDAIMSYLKKHLQPGAFAGLMAAHGVEGFYRSYGVIEHPNHTMGPGMIRYWS